jgi:hypothetical protein
MSDNHSKRVVVWVQHFADRPYLMLQWHDPVTGKRKSRSAETCNPLDAERKRADLEYELNNGVYREASRMSWERFRGLFESEYVAGARLDTRRNYKATLDLFERLCNPASLRSVSERTVSAFVAGMRKEPGRRLGSVGMMESTIKVRLQYLHTALSWAAGQKLLPECPRFPAVKPPKKKPQPVAGESFDKLLEKAPDARMRAFLLCGWLAGCGSPRRTRSNGRRRTPPRGWTSAAAGSSSRPPSSKPWKTSGFPSTRSCGSRWRGCPVGARGYSTSPRSGASG